MQADHSIPLRTYRQIESNFGESRPADLFATILLDRVANFRDEDTQFKFLSRVKVLALCRPDKEIFRTEGTLFGVRGAPEIKLFRVSATHILLLELIADKANSYGVLRCDDRARLHHKQAWKAVCAKFESLSGNNTKLRDAKPEAWHYCYYKTRL